MHIADAIAKFLDPTCSHCNRALESMRSERNDPDIYGSYNMRERQWVGGYVVRPDRNAFGNITHWHVVREDE